MQRRMGRRFAWACFVALASAWVAPAAAQDAPRWYKGNTHMHSFWSDGNDFPEMTIDWHKQRGYHFVSLTDHIRTPTIEAEDERWITQSAMDERVNNPSIDVVARYKARFGEDWVQTRRSQPNEAGKTELEVRLRTLEEYRSLLEEPGEFLLIEGEEITERYFIEPVREGYRGHLVHTNALNIDALIPTQGGDSVRDMVRRHLLAILEHERQIGRPVLAHVNHPQVSNSMVAEDVAYVPEAEFFEIYHGQTYDLRMERFWDVVNTIRLAELGLPPLFAIANDDTHQWHGTGKAPPGKGWIFVRADELTAEALVLAMRRGDFYASNGVTLRDIRYDADTRTVTVEIDPAPGETYTTEFRGTRVLAQPVDHPFDAQAHYRRSNDGVFATQTGTTVSYQLTGDELYVRAVVISDQPPDIPMYGYDGPQFKKARTQPVGWSRHVQDMGACRLHDLLP